MSKYETYILQNMQELKEFASLLRQENVKSYLEIGCKFGGSLWFIGNCLPKGSRLVAVELPHGDTSFKESLPPLQECCEKLRQRGYDAHLIVGDSTNAQTIEQARALGPYDACFIDANHTLPYIHKDWQNYNKMARLVAFHDIGFFRQMGMPPGKKPIQVPIFWNRIKHDFRFLEIRHDKQDNGIGVLWMR